MCSVCFDRRPLLEPCRTVRFQKPSSSADHHPRMSAIRNGSFPVEEMDEFDTIRNETRRHAASLNSISKLLDTIELTVVCFGLIANVIGSITLLKSRHMSTPSFVYHKALGLANLTYCFNFILVKTVRQYAWEPRFPYAPAFTDYVSAFYMGVISRAVASSCGYFVMYMSLLIIADRFLALVLFARYHKFNQMRMAMKLVMISVFLSALGHSWAPWIENQVEKTKIDIPVEDAGIRFVPLTVYAVIPSGRNPSLETAISIKDMFNLIVRLAYATAQTILTGWVVRAFHTQTRKRRTLTTSPARGSSGQAANFGRERSLSCLMLAVAILSCIQVLPREFKRVFDLVYPIDAVLPFINDRSLDIGLRRKYMLLAVYGHGYWKLIANVLTAVERSILFYLYFILNYHFRAEVMAPLIRFVAWIQGRELIETTAFDGGSVISRYQRSRSIITPSAKTSTNTILSKLSTHTMGADTPSLSTAIWINRRLSSCVMLLYAENGRARDDDKRVAHV